MVFALFMNPYLAMGLGVVLTLVIMTIAQNLSSDERKIRYQIEPLYAPDHPIFLQTMGNLLGPPLIGGNRIVSLLNGAEIFPAMLGAIRQAKKTITMETYIYWSGVIGREFSDALIERARHGVKVHILLDWFGSAKLNSQALDEMQNAGIAVERYRPLRWYNLSRLNKRTHRKLLIIDGAVGFIGGAGIADVWLGNAETPEHWRDSHFQVEGPVVAQLQAAFTDNWLKTRAEVFYHEDYFPVLRPQGDSQAQVFKSSPREGSGSVRLMFLISIAAARQHIRIANSYFVPDDQSVAALADAQRRGVRVEVIVPGPLTDMAITRRASRSRWGKLLQAGVEIFEYQPTMYHCKVMIIDRLWVSVGSSNFDNRSFRLNDEANLNALDPDFAAEQIRVFELDKRQSKQITYAAWKNRPWHVKGVEFLAGLLRGQL